VSYQYLEPGDDFGKMDPEWLSKYWSDELIECVLADTWQIMEMFHEKAGFDKRLMQTIGRVPVVLPSPVTVLQS
jgi:hypothetical protein